MYDETIFAKCRNCNCQFAKSAKTSIKNFTAKFPDRPRFSLGQILSGINGRPKQSAAWETNSNRIFRMGEKEENSTAKLTMVWVFDAVDIWIYWKYRLYFNVDRCK